MLWKPVTFLCLALAAAAPSDLLDITNNFEELRDRLNINSYSPDSENDAKKSIYVDLTEDSPDKEDPAQKMILELVAKCPWLQVGYQAAMLADFTDISNHTTARILDLLPERSSVLTDGNLFFFNSQDLATFHENVVGNPYPPGSWEASVYGGGVSVEEIEASKLRMGASESSN